jgi:hypothetical protein
LLLNFSSINFSLIEFSSLIFSIEFVRDEFSFSKLATASLTLFFKDNSEIKD